MKRVLCCFFSLSFASLVYAQDAPPDGVYYIPGMPVPQTAAAESATSSDASSSAASTHAQGRISRVTVSGAQTATTDTPQAPAQAVAAPRVDAEYRGVTPPKRVVPENAQNFSGSRNQIAWIGFQPMSTGDSVFIQTSRPTSFEEIERRDKLLILQLADTALLVSNNARELDMQYFNTAFALAKASRYGKNARVSVEFKEKTAYEVIARDNFIEIRVQKTRPAAESE